MAVKGAVLGDILGSQYEFGRPEDLDWQNVDLIIPGRADFTDDTVMTLAVKDALLNGKDLVETMVRTGRRHSGCGFGGMFFGWILGDDHAPYGSWGNGSAMRTAYVGEYSDDPDIVRKTAELVSAVSHDHPEGIKGAVVTSMCIWMARHGHSKEEIYSYVLENYPAEQYSYSINHDLQWLRKHYQWTEKCCDTVPAAMRCFYESTDYESFIRNIYSLKCDSDTFGAIAGGVAEEYYGGFGSIDAEKILKECLTKDLYEILTA